MEISKKKKKKKCCRNKKRKTHEKTFSSPSQTYYRLKTQQIANTKSNGSDQAIHILSLKHEKLTTG